MLLPRDGNRGDDVHGERATERARVLVELTESAIDGLPLIIIEGELDHASKRAVLDAINDLFRGAYPPRSVLIDLTDCAFLDSGGLSVLLSTLARVPADGWLGIIGASAGPNRVLEYTGFMDHDKVRFFSSRSDAAASLAREKRLL
jgi:anti-anti-sigma factor